MPRSSYRRRAELRRYRAHVRELLADYMIGWDAKMHPDFALTDQDAADVHDEVERELRKEQPNLLMLTATTRPGAGSPDEQEEPGFCLGVRFCYPADVAHVEKLLIEQVRKRYALYTGMTPLQVRAALLFTVWAVPDPPKRGGWPEWLGPAGYYH